MYLGQDNFKNASKLIESKQAQASDLFYDWFCTDKKLVKLGETNYKRVKMLLNILKIDESAVQVFFKNCCPFDGDLFDRIYIQNAKDEEKFICISPKLGYYKHHYKKCEMYLNILDVEEIFEDWTIFKKLVKYDTKLQNKIRKELGL